MPTKIVAVLIPGGKLAETKPQFLLSTERVRICTSAALDTSCTAGDVFGLPCLHIIEVLMWCHAGS